MVSQLKALLTLIKRRPLYEKILFFISLFAVLGVAVYTVCGVPYNGNSETYMPLLLAKDSIRTGSILSPSFMYRNEVWFFSPHLLFIIPGLFTDSTSICIIVVGAMLVLGGSVILIYCSRKVSLNNCWLIYLAIFWCGFSANYIKFMFRLHGYIFMILLMFLIYTLSATSFDEDLKVNSWKKLILASLLILLMLISGIKYAQVYSIPIAGALIIYFIINHLGDNGICKTIKSKDFLRLLVAVGAIFFATVFGYLVNHILIDQDLVNVVLTKESVMSFAQDIGENIHKLLIIFMSICGVKDGSLLFSLNGIVDLAKVIINILMLIIFPVLQLKNYKNETTTMKLFMLFSLIHVAEILVLCVFFNAISVSTDRYLFSSIMLLYYLSANYIYKYILCSENKFGIKALITVAAAFVFAVPSSFNMAAIAKSYERNISSSRIVVDFLESKGLSYGYGTYWNSDNYTAFSDFQVKVSKIWGVDKTILPHRNGHLGWSYDYSEDAYQGTTFLLLTKAENDMFLTSESYVKFGKPTEVCTIADYTVYIYDYNIANNNFRGEYAGFTGSELETISAVCRENNVDLAFVYDAGHINTILRGDIDNLEEIDGDTSILAVTHENLAEPASKLNISVGEFSLYICKMSQVEYTPNPNYVAGSDFNSGEDLKEWAIGSGETAVCDNGVLTVTCTKESDRRFNQTVTISEEQVGSPMIFSFKVNKVSGSHVSRVYGTDFSEDRYIIATITEPGIYSFSFVPTSTQITVQPIVPSTLGSSAEIDWVKLENGNIFTGYVPFAVDTNLAEGSDSQDGGGREDLATDGSETADVNPNLAAGSDFQNNGDLEDWIIGGGETAVCEDGALMLTCSEEKDRRFDQIIKISDEQIGKPMTLSYEISGIDGYVLTRVWGEDFKEDRWISEAISEPGVYMFTFTPTSGEFTIQPALPEKLNNSVSVEWVKLETGSDATDFVPYAA